MTLYFFVSAVETIFLGLYLIQVGSIEGNQVLFSLSLSRLVLIAAVFLAAGVFIYLAILSNRRNRQQKGFLSTFITNRKKLVSLFLGCMVIVITMFLALTRQPSFWRDYRLIAENLKPIFVWILVLAFQAAFFSLVWFCLYFVINKGKSSVEANKKELLPVFLIFFAALIAKWFIVSNAAYGPTGTGDEMTYYDMADSMQRGFFSITQTHHYPPLYPTLLMPALMFGQYTYALIKLVNALLSTSIIFPTYLLSRSFLDSKKSLLPVLIACALPYHLVFPRRLVSENLYFPVFLWTTLLVHAKPAGKKDALIWDILTGVALGLLYLSRYISLVVIPMFLIAWWIKPFGEQDNLLKPSLNKILRFLLIGMIAVLVFSPWVMAAIREGLPVKSALGFEIASKTTSRQLTLFNFFKWVYLYSSYLILISAPVLPLLLKSLSDINFKKWREANGRLIFEILAVIGGFLAAASRHSWRAYYNRIIPTTIMGRYVLFLSIPFIILAFITLNNERMPLQQAQESSASNKRSQRKSEQMRIWPLLISVALVLLAYTTLISENILTLGEEFMRPEGSVDGHYLKVIGVWFFILVPALYALYYLYFNRKGLKLKRIRIIPIVTALLVAFYSLGWPAYYQYLITKQIYPWLSSQIASLAWQDLTRDEIMEEITVYIPATLDGKVNAELYNGLRVRDIDNSHIEDYEDYVNEGNLAEMPTQYGYIIEEIQSNTVADESTSRYSFNGREFSIKLVSK